MAIYRVADGDTLSSIAARYGLSWQDLYYHANNAGFRADHSSPDLIYPGDNLWVPDPEAADEPEPGSEPDDQDADGGDDADESAVPLDDRYVYVDPGPTGTGEYEIQQGECLSLIAKRSGFLWKTLWEHPGNAQLRSVRQDPNVLLPGDHLHIPKLREKVETRPTDQLHKFVLKGEPCRLRLTIMDYDQPRSGQPYHVVLDNKAYDGTLDDAGRWTSSFLRMPLGAPLPWASRRSRRRSN